MSKITIGIDLGDQYSAVYILDEAGECLESGRVRTKPAAVRQRLGGMPPSRVVVEAGTHSPWVSREVEALGHEVIVANPRKLRGIYGDDKADQLDAEQLARLGRLDPALLRGISHRSAEAQADLAVLRARDSLVRARASLILHLRGVVKGLGGRLPACSAEAFAHRVEAHIPTALAAALQPLLAQVSSMTQAIREYDRQVETLCEKRYPATAQLRQVVGVGAITALTFVLIVDDPSRFRRSRTVGAYLGLRPRRHQSGERDPQLRITKAGSPLLRRLLVQAAHYILGPFGSDCDLRRHGLRLAARGGAAAKKRAVIAVARKLAVLLHRLWVSGTAYEPLRQAAVQAAS